MHEFSSQKEALEFMISEANDGISPEEKYELIRCGFGRCSTKYPTDCGNPHCENFNPYREDFQMRCGDC